MTDLVPMEFNVVVEMAPVEEKTAGGIILPGAKLDQDKHAAAEGTLVAVSPLAFSYADWPEDRPPPAVGSKVLIARYSGVERETGGKTYRIVKDKDVLAVIKSAAEAVRAAA